MTPSPSGASVAWNSLTSRPVIAAIAVRQIALVSKVGSADAGDVAAIDIATTSHFETEAIVTPRWSARRPASAGITRNPSLSYAPYSSGVDRDQTKILLERHARLSGPAFRPRL